MEEARAGQAGLRDQKKGGCPGLAGRGKRGVAARRRRRKEKGRRTAPRRAEKERAQQHKKSETPTQGRQATGAAEERVSTWGQATDTRRAVATRIV